MTPAILAIVIKPALILSIGIVAAGALRRTSAAVRHWVLATTLIGASVAPVIGWSTPSWRLPALSAHERHERTAVDVSLTIVAGQLAASTPTSDPRPVGATSIRSLVASAIIPVWLIGAGVNVTFLLVGMRRLARLRASCVGGDVTQEEVLARVSRQFALRRSVALLDSPWAVIVTWGMWRPKIVLPADAVDWPRDRLLVVLAHEVAHIARGDWVVQTVAEFCKAVYWFNPLFWIACARLRNESERACDDAVMNVGVTSQVYATALLEIARSLGRRGEGWLPAPAMAVRSSNLERRVRAMLNSGLNRDPVTRAGRWAFALLTLTITLPVATFAQAGFTTFSGTVVDPQDRLLPGTTITVSDPRRDVKHETKTDRNGRFELVGLPAGDYTFEAKLPGFRTLTDNFTVNEQSLDRTFKMQVSELQETIFVSSDDGAITSAHQRGNTAAKRPNPACAPGNVNGLGGNIRPPHKVKDVAPGYPGVPGNVQLVATIGTDGSVTEVQVVKADRPELVPSAVDAVRQWEFDSTLLNCIPIEVQMNVSVSFRQNQ